MGGGGGGIPKRFTKAALFPMNESFFCFLSPDILQPVILFLFIYLFIYLLICLFNLFAQSIFHLVTQLMRNLTGKTNCVLLN